MLKVAIPAAELALVVPYITLFVDSVRTTVLVGVYKFPSSPNRFTVIAKVKPAEGDIFVDDIVILKTKLVIGKEALIAVDTPGAVASIVKVPADKIRKLLNINWPFTVFPVVVPEKVPVGFKVKVTA